MDGRASCSRYLFLLCCCGAGACVVEMYWNQVLSHSGGEGRK